MCVSESVCEPRPKKRIFSKLNRLKSTFVHYEGLLKIPISSDLDDDIQLKTLLIVSASTSCPCRTEAQSHVLTHLQGERGDRGDQSPSTSGKASMKSVLEGLGELWDQQQYDTEYNLDTFMGSLK